MSSLDYSEDTLVEQPAIALLDALGWETVNCFHEFEHARGSPLGRETKGEVVLTSRLRPALEKLNPDASPEAIDLAAGQVPNCRNLSEDDTTTTGLDSIDAGCFFVLGTDFNQVDCRDCQGFAVDSIARQLCQPPLTP